MEDCQLYPTLNEGRFFVSPIVGCSGKCSYCYLDIRGITAPRKNNISAEQIIAEMKNNTNFVWGKNGTIVSVGAWGDIFPLNNTELIEHSVCIIKNLLALGNPVQIMSKNVLNEKYVQEIARAVCYKGQLLYSTSITTVNDWEKIEFGTSSPEDRLKTCLCFHEYGIATNVLLKPFIPELIRHEMVAVSDMLIKFCVDYCTIGIMYWDPSIEKKISANSFLNTRIKRSIFSAKNHLDCDGDNLLQSSQVDILLPYVTFLREKGIQTFLKSSCVSSHVLQMVNPSGYYKSRNPYCVDCGICKASY